MTRSSKDIRLLGCKTANATFSFLFPGKKEVTLSVFRAESDTERIFEDWVGIVRDEGVNIISLSSLSFSEVLLSVMLGGVGMDIMSVVMLQPEYLSVM